MDVQMQSALFKPPDPISHPSILHYFKSAGASYGIDGGVATWLFQHFVKVPAKFALSYSVYKTDNKLVEREENLTTDRQVKNYLLATYEKMT